MIRNKTARKTIMSTIVVGEVTGKLVSLPPDSFSPMLITSNGAQAFYVTFKTSEI